MNADTKTPRAKGKSYDRAAQAKFRREVAEFKRFFDTSIRNMLRGKASLIILNVVEDPCTKGRSMMSRQIKGPPDTSN